jgi:hypothetical protein
VLPRHADGEARAALSAVSISPGEPVTQGGLS